MIKERPILFSAAMVQACMREVDPKTVTRRIVKPQPEKIPDDTWQSKGGNGYWWAGMPARYGMMIDVPYMDSMCPYGQPGDRLWVRETWQALHVTTDFETGHPDDWWHAKKIPKDSEDGYWGAAYAATEPAEGRDDRGFPWRPAIHMPRWASRLSLEITWVKVERLQDITEEQAILEGVERNCIHADLTGYNEERDGWINYMEPMDGGTPCGTARESFRTLWESINGPGSWEANPWVWAVSFRRIP